MLMRSLTRIRAAGYPIMLVFAGVLAMPLPSWHGYVEDLQWRRRG